VIDYINGVETTYGIELTNSDKYKESQLKGNEV